MKGSARRVVIQGFGNAGSHMAHLLHEAGWRIVGVSDSSGAIFSAEGLDPAAVLEAKRTSGNVASYAKSGRARLIDSQELLALDCELLVPSAMEDLINEKNADSIRARVVLELANGPVTAEADHILERKGIAVVPDILANAGGVTVSYFEWVQNRQGYYWELEEVQSKLKAIMEREGRRVWTVAQSKQITLRTAAYVHALSRLSQAIEAHGTQAYFVR